VIKKSENPYLSHLFIFIPKKLFMRKNLFVTTIIILIVNFAFAQSTRFGFYAGPVAATMFEKVSGVKHNHDYGLGASIGVLLDVPMQKVGSFQPGFNFITKNSKDDVISNGQTVKTTTLLSYIELPLNVLFRIPAGAGKVTLGGGVAVAKAIKGKMTGTNNEKKDLSFGDNASNDFGIYDFGINALAGYEFKNNFFVTLNYNYGINRLFVGGDPKDKLYNRYIALRVGYLISGKK
jgi:hypothetical protein